MSSNPVYSTLADDPEMAELIGLFVADMPRRMDLLQVALTAADRDGLARISHQLKGAAGSYGFGMVTDCAGKLELGIEQGEALEQLALSIQELASLCASLSAESPISDVTPVTQSQR